MEDEKEIERQYLKLSTEDRCQHKLWKARVNGYEAAKKIFEQSTDEKSPEFNKYLGIIKKFVIDSNAIAQEKGLDAVLAYVENAACAGKTTGEVICGVVQKCLAAPKTKTKEKGLEIVLMYVEIEKFEVVQEEIIKGLENKNPKVVTACVNTLTEILRNFGHKVLTLKPIVKIVPKLLEDRDKNVREATKALTVEIYRWIGVPIKAQLQNLKPLQLTELEKEFEKVGVDKPHQIRYLKSQQDLRIRREAIDGGEEDPECDDAQDEPEEAPIDLYELLDPVDILSKLPKDFYDKCEAKKWQERKEAMEALQTLASNPKLEAGDYHDVVKALKKIIAKDNNIMVATAAAKCLTGLANGLKKKFQSYAVSCVSIILEKFKEKKVMVLQAMREASDAVFACTTLDAIMEDLIAYLQNKNPTIRSETLSYIGRIFSKLTPAILTKKVLKPFCIAILVTLNDADGIVRDNSAIVLGTAMKVVGEKGIGPFLQDLDNIKMGKIKECCDKAEVVAFKTPKAAAKTQKTATAKPQPGPSRSASASSVSKTSSETKGQKTRPPAKEKATKAVRGGKKKASATTEKEIPNEKELGKEEAAEMVENILPGDVLSNLSSTNWKERLAAMEKFAEVVQSTDGNQLPTQALIVLLGQKPGFKDTNFQVLNLKFSTLSEIATKSANFSQTATHCCIKDIIDKIGDVKTGAGACHSLGCIAEATTLKFISSEAMSYAFTQKNPKNQIEGINWLAKSIKEFGFNIDLKPIINYTKQGLAATNPGIRAACISLIGTMFLYMGQALRTFYEDQKPALLQQIDSELEKVKGTSPPPPTRGTAARNGVVDDEGGDEDNDEPAAPEINLADMIPRSDYGNQIPSAVITELSDKNWKVRAEALDKLKALLSELKFIKPNLGDLPTSLKQRLSDTNKNLLIQFLIFTESLGTALGPGTKQHVRNLAPSVFAALGDNKNTVRAAALACLNTWTEHASFSAFVDGEMLLETFKSENPFMRTEMMGWVADGLTDSKNIQANELGIVTPVLFSCIEDRSADVRKKAQEAVLPFMIHLGYEAMVRAAGKLKPASKMAIMAHLDKARPLVPAKPSKSANKAQSKKKVAEDNETLAVNNKNSAQSKESSAKRATSKTRKPEVKPPGKKKEEEAECGPALGTNNLKEQRTCDEKALRILKWNFTTPRDEFVDQLKDQMNAAGFNRSFQANLFHSDFKYHLKAIETLNESIDSCPEATIFNVDLIIKWISLRFFDTNPSVLLKSIEYLQQLFILVISSKCRLSDLDASSFVPYLILKVGDPKDPVRKGVREIFRLLYKVYPSNKMFVYLMQGLASKNARQRTECLEELGCLIESYGMSVCQPSAGAALKEIAKQISDRDNSVRNAALNCIVQAYFIEGEKVYKLVGKLGHKDLSLLEERIKRASKNRPTINPGIKEVAPESRMARPATCKAAISSETTEPCEDESAPNAEPVPSVVHKRMLARPLTARPASSGPFTLDFDAIEQMVEGNDDVSTESRTLTLIKHDFTEMFDSIPALPKTKSRPPSPAQKVLKLSSDAASTMDLVISQIASNNITTSVCALAQIDELLLDAEKAEGMVSRVDQMLLTISLQYRMVYNRHMSNPQTSKLEVVKLYRSLTMTILSLLQNNILAKTATTDVLRDLFHNLLTVILDPRLNDIDEGPQVSRSINCLMVKAFERCDQTNIFCALIKLLQDCVANEACSIKLTELVMKCLWKLIRMLPKILPNLTMDKILLELHIFLKTYPFVFWKQRSIDTPLRTVKTILHSLVKNLGSKVLDHLGLIDNKQESEVEAYLFKVLGGMKSDMGFSASSPDVVADATNAARRDGRAVMRSLSKIHQDKLSIIFTKIGSKKYTKEGLYNLYDFKQQYPDADVDQFMKKSSKFFQEFIEAALQKIDQERNNNVGAANINLSQPTTLPPAASSSTVYSTKTSGIITEMPNPSIYMEKLKALRAKAGLDNSKYDRNADNVKKTPLIPLAHSRQQEEAENISIQTSTVNNMNTGGNGNDGENHSSFLENIRKRLEAAKKDGKC